MRAAGMNATVSSIHINGWYGTHDKLEGARWIVRQRLGRDLDAELNDWVYIGDSTNDQRMFQHFRTAWRGQCARFVPAARAPAALRHAARGAAQTSPKCAPLYNVKH